jgi:hypothetical protein
VNFTVSFISNPFQEKDTSESAEVFSSVLEENASEREPDITNLQKDLPL